MATIQDQVRTRFDQLASEVENIPLGGDDVFPYADATRFYAWASSALNVVQGVFGKTSPHYERLNAEISGIANNCVYPERLNACRGTFLGAKSDVDGGFVFNLETTFTGEVFGDIVSAARAALDEGQHVVATILACAALEDALKRFAVMNDLAVEGKTMDEVVNALKSSGLVGGAQKTLLAAMPKIRNYAMHADWQKLSPQDAGSVIGFVEQFLLTHFS